MCKKTGSYILIAVLLLTILTACGGKTPTEPVETDLYHALITGNTERTHWEPWFFLAIMRVPMQ